MNGVLESGVMDTLDLLQQNAANVDLDYRTHTTTTIACSNACSGACGGSCSEDCAASCGGGCSGSSN
ncbi:MAG: hypothetical protein Ta2B_16530 [Termitinemataceae bacterium]|nr:MAG: hypothetical protein Ta2B_16530 [Termitinemataceae bacterium]